VGGEGETKRCVCVCVARGVCVRVSWNGGCLRGCPCFAPSGRCADDAQGKGKEAQGRFGVRVCVCVFVCVRGGGLGWCGGGVGVVVLLVCVCVCFFDSFFLAKRTRRGGVCVRVVVSRYLHFHVHLCVHVSVVVVGGEDR
jgi:hypothetical protein